MIAFETERLLLRRLDAGDAPFILELVNDPGWLRYIGDKKVHSLDDARGYIANGPVAMYEKRGFGLWLVQQRKGSVPIGLCGLLKRDTLADVDIGFAFLGAWRGQGHAFEAAAGTLAHGRDAFGLSRIVAITTPTNAPSAKLLRRLGMDYVGLVTLGEDAEPLHLHAIDFAHEDD